MKTRISPMQQNHIADEDIDKVSDRPIKDKKVEHVEKSLVEEEERNLDEQVFQLGKLKSVVEVIRKPISPAVRMEMSQDFDF